MEQKETKINCVGLPQRVVVKSPQESRYFNNERPLSWDERCEGIDKVVSSEGHIIELLSDAGQSPPKSGWILILTSGDSQSGFRWTLYGLVPVQGGVSARTLAGLSS